MPADAVLPFPLFRRGKVRDVYDLGDRLLIVATDRLSAFDVVLPTPIQGKGRTLTGISNWWFDSTSTVMPNHRTGESLATLELPADIAEELDGRATIAMKAERIDVECVVRSHLAGTGWKEYQQSGTLAGETLPLGLGRASKLPELRFTPAVKNDVGHDENISRNRLRSLIGNELAETIESASLAMFRHAEPLARQAGFILADTKFEFGFVDGVLTVIDEIFTPDSSRYWDAAAWQPGEEPASFDKQPIRDWLETTDWNKEAPGPIIPDTIVTKTQQRYGEVLRRLESLSGGTR